MAAQALLAEQLTLNAVDYTALGLVKGATLVVDVDKLDPTAFGTGWKKVLGGLKEGTLNINLVDDVAAGSVDALLWPLLGTIVTFEVRLSTAVVGTSNPKYTGSVLIGSHTIGGQVGELAMKSGLTFNVDGVVTRATA